MAPISGGVEAGGIRIVELYGGMGSYEVHFLVHAVRRGFEDYRPVVSGEEFAAGYLDARVGGPTEEGEAEAPSGGAGATEYKGAAVRSGVRG